MKSEPFVEDEWSSYQRPRTKEHDTIGCSVLTRNTEHMHEYRVCGKINITFETIYNADEQICVTLVLTRNSEHTNIGSVVVARIIIYKLTQFITRN